MAPPEAEQTIAVQNVYCNGFQISLSNADVSAVLLLNNVPVLSLSISYTTAKTLAEALTEMMATLEKVTERKIMTTKQVAEGLEKLTGEGGRDGKPN